MTEGKKSAMALSAGLLAVVLALAVGCTKGGDEGSNMEDKYASALAELNPDWVLYEIGESRGAVTIKVEAQEIVNFQEAKKAVEAIQAVDPKFQGYIDFFDAKTGTVVRKMEIMPVIPAPAKPAEKPAE
ncbi:MAG: hypothetical protein OEZ55_09065 [Nitrospinota bacterium]|nr:hypothetical protein [Nitrospinota bacterium]